MVAKKVVQKSSDVSLTQAEYDDAIRAAKWEGWNTLAKEAGITDMVNPYEPQRVLSADEKVTRKSARKKVLAEVVWLSNANQMHGYLTTEIVSLCGVNRPTTALLPASTDFVAVVDYCPTCFADYNKLVQKQGGGTASKADARGIYV